MLQHNSFCLPVFFMRGYHDFMFYVTPTQNHKINNKSDKYYINCPKSVPNMFTIYKNTF